MRVYEFARELGVTSKQVLQECAELGIEVKNHMSSVDEATQAKLKKRLTGGRPAAPEAPAKPAPVSGKRAAPKLRPCRRWRW